MRKQRNPKLIDFLRILTKSIALGESSEHSPGQTMETLQTIGMETPADSSEHGFPIWTHELQYLSCQSRQ